LLGQHGWFDPAYFDAAPPGQLLVVPHHTNATSAGLYTPDGMPIWSHYHWPPGHYDPRYFRLGEMVQTRGCFESEAADPAWKVRAEAGGGSLRTALSRGFRVGFTAGTDNHCGWPGRQTGGWVGLTAVYAGSYSRAGIMSGLHRRRCYATTGARMGIDFHSEGNMVRGTEPPSQSDRCLPFHFIAYPLERPLRSRIDLIRTKESLWQLDT